MIIIDTNIVSEVMKAAPAAAVIEWLNERETLSLYLIAITVAEIEYGLAIMPGGKRRNKLQTLFEKFISNAFEQRILDFNQETAFVYGDLMAKRKQKGKPMSILDGQIAAIAKCHSFTIATRNTKDFNGCEIKLINPFEYTKAK